MKIAFPLSVILLATFGLMFAQETVPSEAEQIVLDWFERWNALDGSDEATEHVVGLYRSDAMHQVGPNPRQIGPVVFDGAAAIRKMTADFARDHTDLTYRIQTVTANEQSTDLLHVAEGPWSGLGVAVEFVAVYTEKASGTRFMHPGAIFFQIQDGKIRRARTYLGHRELTPIVP